MRGRRWHHAAPWCVVALLLSGCADGPGSSAPDSVGGPVPAVTPWTAAAPTSAPAAGEGSDVVVGAIRSAPAACGLPEHHLSGYRGRVGQTETVLQVDEGYGGTMPPVPPVTVDLSGGAGLELVGVLSCTVDGASVADHLVLYTGPATPAASLDLGTVQRQRFAVVRGLRTAGGDVEVQWTAFDVASGPVVQYEGRVAVRDGKLAVTKVRRSSGPRTVRLDAGTFMTADGNVHCVMQPQAIWCDVLASTWTPPPSPPPTAPSPGSASPSASPGRTASTAPTLSTATTAVGCGTRPYGRTFLIVDGRARRGCAGEQGVEIAALGSPLTAWHRQGWDATVVVDGRRSAALTPGSAMATSAARCTATASEVTCTDSRTRAGFTVGRSRAQVRDG